MKRRQLDGATTLSRMTISTMTEIYSLLAVLVTVKIFTYLTSVTQRVSFFWMSFCYVWLAECHFVECHFALSCLVGVIVLNVTLLSVIILVDYSAECHSLMFRLVECHSALFHSEYFILVSVILMCVIVLNVVLLSVIVLNIILLNAVAPISTDWMLTASKKNDLKIECLIVSKRLFY